MPAPPISIQPEYLQTRHPLAVAEEARDVRLDRRLREREVVGAEADLPLLAEQGAHEVEQRSLQVGERDAAVDRQPLDLVEDRDVRRVGRVSPVDPPERDDVDGRLLRPPSPCICDGDVSVRSTRLVVEEERRQR